MFCSKCGAKNEKGAEFCTECGTSLKENTNVQAKSGSSIGWGVLGFFIPLVGLILFLCWKNDRPSDSKAAGIGALISVIINVVITVIAIALIGVAASQSIYY